MARSLPNTDGSQFFVCVATNTAWDGNYTVFGQTLEGFDVISALRVGDVIEGIDIIK